MTTHDADAMAEFEAWERTVEGVYQPTEEDWAQMAADLAALDPEELPDWLAEVEAAEVKREAA